MTKSSYMVRFAIGVGLRIALTFLAASTLDRGKNLIAFCTLMIVADISWLAWTLSLVLKRRRLPIIEDHLAVLKIDSFAIKVFLLLPVIVHVLAILIEDPFYTLVTHSP